MILIKAIKDSEAGVMPSEQLLTEMGKFNEEPAKAGVMLAGEGPHPTSKGARVIFAGGRRTVIDGPFAGTKELIAGYWLWQCKWKEEAIEWVTRCPNPHNEDGEVVAWRVNPTNGQDQHRRSEESTRATVKLGNAGNSGRRKT